MQLSLHADYALRVLVYLAADPDRLISTQEISSAYGISKNHLVRVIQTLADHQYVSIQTGRSGGVQLGCPASEIRLGDVVRHAEPNLRLVECFEHETNTCPIAPACALKGMLRQALEAFLENLNEHTVADVLARSGPAKLNKLFVSFGGWTGSESA